MKVKVIKYNTKKDFRRYKYFDAVDVSEQVQQPLIDVERLDTTLDSTSLILLNKNSEPITPFTRFKFTITDDNGNVEKFYRVVYTDSVSVLSWSTDSSKVIYQHNVELLEITKWLERFDVDNTTITNYLMFLYTDEAVYMPQESTPVESFHASNLVNATSNVKDFTENKSGVNIYSIYPLGNTYNINTRYTIQATSRTSAFIISALLPFTTYLDISKFTITTPSGTEYNLLDTTASNYKNPESFTFNEVGQYTIKQTYHKNNSIAELWDDFTFYVECQDMSTKVQEKVPERKTILDVVNKVLGNITFENNVRLANETPIFQIDSSLIDRLKAINSPEFTFTQNTLFGVLMEIGQYIHAIPRLVPNKNDDTNWDTISFDFWGETESGDLGVEIAKDNSINGDNYTSAYVSNVENSFQTNNVEYISMVEPYENGFVSARTESSNYEISNDEAVIKTSRPIQRITELWVGYTEATTDSNGNTTYTLKEYDIAPYVMESTNYNLLSDYGTNSSVAKGTKSTAIYYTRGDNVIRGLCYVMPDKVSILETFSKRQSIFNILYIVSKDTRWLNKTNYVKDLMFRIKYVPYYNFKMKQYKPLIDENSGSNNLYYNQSAQSVDIEAFGENLKGALMMTGNKEPSITARYNDLTKVIKAGQVVNDNWFAYQVNREFANGVISATTTFSKDWNKWNEYTAIKKNYREWEISEKESISQNPVYNDFCIVSDEIDFDKLKVLPETSEYYAKVKETAENYIKEVDAQEMFCNKDVSLAIMNSFIMSPATDNAGAIRWLIARTTQDEWNGSEYAKVQHSFMLPCSCFSVGNSIVLTATTQDNYGAGTFTTESSDFGLSSGYALEQTLEYGNKYGEVDSMECYFGSKDYQGRKWDGQSVDTMEYGKYLYNVDFSKVSETGTWYSNRPTILQIKNNPLKISKDSRQQLALTFQLNFVSEKDYIWIGSGFCQNTWLVGNTSSTLRVVYFNKAPDKFLSKNISEFSSDDYTIAGQVGGVISQSYLKYDLSADSMAFRFNTTRGVNYARQDYVGGGLIDTNGKIVIYYNKKIRKNFGLPNIYFMFRKII